MDKTDQAGKLDNVVRNGWAFDDAGMAGCNSAPVSVAWLYCLTVSKMS